MSHYVAYVPGLQVPNADRIPSGLQPLLRFNPGMSVIEEGGPDGGHGLFLAWDQQQTYQPGRYQWTSAPANKSAGEVAGAWHLGLDPQSPPAPTDLALPRAEQLAGHPVTLGDGRDWLIPSLLQLEQAVILEPDGVRNEVVPRLRALHEQGLWAYDLARAHITARQPLPVVECVRYVADLLCRNYRLTPWIATTLGLITTSNFWAALAWSVDIEELMRLEQDLREKKSRETAHP